MLEIPSSLFNLPSDKFKGIALTTLEQIAAGGAPPNNILTSVIKIYDRLHKEALNSNEAQRYLNAKNYYISEHRRI